MGEWPEGEKIVRVGGEKGEGGEKKGKEEKGEMEEKSPANGREEAGAARTGPTICRGVMFGPSAPVRAETRLRERPGRQTPKNSRSHMMCSHV